MEQATTKIKYFLYARKSSEDKDRQIQSIPDQVNRLKQLANSLNLDIKQIYTESKSAKEPDNRPLFTEMMERIENGEADGILCWQINRLSRNAVDSGRLIWLLQQGTLKSIQTIDRQYLPEDNVLILGVESGVANQFILDLSKNVRRGIQRKLDEGWRPGSAALGYANDLANHTIIKDQERFNLMRKAWDLMLTGNYTVAEILGKLNKEWGFRTPRKKSKGDKELSKSGLYAIFTNLFYAGIIVHKGKHYQGKHEPMITLEEYDRVQVLLGRKGRQRIRKHKFAFSGSIRCGECGHFYVGEEHLKLIKSTGEIKSYVYYYCKRKSTETKCSQRKGIKEEDLESQIEKELAKYTILPEFLHWALEGLNKKNDVEIDDRSKIYEMQHKSLTKAQSELDELTRMRYRQLINDDIFIKERDILENKIVKLKEVLRETETRAEKWLELTEKTFNFATYARKAFITGGLELKKEILMTLGQNPIIKDGKLIIEPNEWLQPIADHYPALEEEYLRLELSGMPMNKEKTEALTSVISRWQGRQASNL